MSTPSLTATSVARVSVHLAIPLLVGQKKPHHLSLHGSSPLESLKFSSSPPLLSPPPPPWAPPRCCTHPGIRWCRPPRTRTWTTRTGRPRRSSCGGRRRNLEKKAPDGTFKLTSVTNLQITIVTFMWYSTDMFHYTLWDFWTYECNKFGFKHVMKHVIRIPHKRHNFFS